MDASRHNKVVVSATLCACTQVDTASQTPTQDWLLTAFAVAAAAAEAIMEARRSSYEAMSSEVSVSVVGGRRSMAGRDFLFFFRERKI